MKDTLDVSNARERFSLAEGFSEVELREAYRVLALIYHPDRFGDQESRKVKYRAEAEFKRLNADYELLKAWILKRDRESAKQLSGSNHGGPQLGERENQGEKRASNERQNPTPRNAEKHIPEKSYWVSVFEYTWKFSLGFGLYGIVTAGIKQPGIEFVDRMLTGLIYGIGISPIVFVFGLIGFGIRHAKKQRSSPNGGAMYIWAAAIVILLILIGRGTQTQPPRVTFPTTQPAGLGRGDLQRQSPAPSFSATQMNHGSDRMSGISGQSLDDSTLGERPDAERRRTAETAFKSRGLDQTADIREVRTWTDNQGRTLQAKFLRIYKDRFGNWQGTFERPNGKQFTWPIAEFSMEDRRLIFDQSVNVGMPD